MKWLTIASFDKSEFMTWKSNVEDLCSSTKLDVFPIKSCWNYEMVGLTNG